MSVRLVLALHFHQPVGNFDHVFEEAVEKCYGPVLSHFERHPGVRAAFHFSGCLLEWLEDRNAKFLDRLLGLVGRGQIEPLGGGFYEPILTVIPREDALEQLNRLSEYWRRKCGVRPVGMWLPERVWEPSLPEILAEAGLRYTVLDDQHLRFAGLLNQHFSGVYVTERLGKPIAFFPSDFKLRYMIPFRAIDQLREYLTPYARDSKDWVLTYGDDAEKFGLWPKTHRWVFEEKWLEKFLTELETGGDFARTVSPSAYLAEHPPMQSVYMPNASYAEMLEWSLPSDSVAKYARARNAALHTVPEETVKAFVRGSLWDGFLARYPEANQMHKHALYTSRRARAVKNPRLRERAVTSVLRAQCNCAYWHGLFGGVYLPHLRHGVYRSLLDADAAIAEADGGGIRVAREDFDGDFEDEMILSSKAVQAFFRPADGGTLSELDYLPSRFNLTNVISRWKESYHEGADVAHGMGGSGGVTSPHESTVEISPADLKNWHFDTYPVRSFRDFTAAGTVDAAGLGTFAGMDMARGRMDDLKTDATGFEGYLGVGQLRVRKRVELRGPEELAVSWKIERNPGSAPWFGTLLYFTLLARDAPDRFITVVSDRADERKVAPSSNLELERCQRIELTDLYFGFIAQVIPSPTARVVTAPVETLQRSEGGYESTYQGTLIAVLWPTDGAPAPSLRILFRGKQV